MTPFPLSGYISSPQQSFDGCVLYVIEETSPGTFSGRIGYGRLCDGLSCDHTVICIQPDGSEVDEGHATAATLGNIAYHPSDMRDFAFHWDPASRTVTIQCAWRVWAANPDEEGRPYLRFPRSKDGIDVSDVIATLFPTDPVTIEYDEARRN